MIDISDQQQEMVRRAARRLPVIGTCILLFGTWLLFLVYVSIKHVLIKRGEVGRFLSQLVIFHTLLGLTLLSFLVSWARRPLRPDQTFAPPDARPLRPDDVRPPRNAQGSVDDDDIPLRMLREGALGQASTLNASDSHANATGRGDGDDDEAGEEHALLDKDEPDVQPVTLMAKGGTGFPRWCRKCDGWKPDRCHHCRSCGQCVLKMDHHCPWLDNCVGYHNYKPFLLFTTYATLLAAYGCSQAAYETYRFFHDPPQFPGDSMEHEDVDEFALDPVIHMLLTVVGAVFGLAVGGLAAYHWYLAMNNRTTLEDMSRATPTALLDQDTRDVLESLGDRGSRQRLPGAWRPDHILTRAERVRLRNEAHEVNVYDMGWRTNLKTVMIGDDAPLVWRSFGRELLGAAWPLKRPRRRRHGGGHFFPYDPAALERLKGITAEVRLGIAPGPDTPQHSGSGSRWGIGRASESDSDSGDDADDEIDPPPFYHESQYHHQVRYDV